jgi:hypothetical protein
MKHSAYLALHTLASGGLRAGAKVGADINIDSKLTDGTSMPETDFLVQLTKLLEQKGFKVVIGNV